LGAPVVRYAAALLSLLMVSVLVVTASRAAFSDTTDNAANSWAAGTVTITDDDSGSAMFSVTAMKPGQTVTNCIAVTYSGTLTPADVKLYGSTGGTGLDAYLDTTVEIGTGGSFGDCTGFTTSSTLFSGTLASFASTYTNWASGLAAWSPASTPESRTFKFTMTLQDDNSAQGLDATATFTWEAQNQ
jgi:hypothetical protein